MAHGRGAPRGAPGRAGPWRSPVTSGCFSPSHPDAPARVALSRRGDSKVARPGGPERCRFARPGRWFFNTEITEEDEVTEKKARPRAPGRIPPAAKPQRPEPPAPETRARPSRFSVISSSSVISVLNRRLRRCHAAGTGRSNRAGRAGRGQATNVLGQDATPYFSQSTRALARSLPRQGLCAPCQYAQYWARRAKPPTRQIPSPSLRDSVRNPG